MIVFQGSVFRLFNNIVIIIFENIIVNFFFGSVSQAEERKPQVRGRHDLNASAFRRVDEVVNYNITVNCNITILLLFELYWTFLAQKIISSSSSAQ